MPSNNATGLILKKEIWHSIGESKISNWANFKLYIVLLSYTIII